eukprot:scaffold18788_cov62-Phaeocystis_antarctica.AAC.6
MPVCGVGRRSRDSRDDCSRCSRVVVCLCARPGSPIARVCSPLSATATATFTGHCRSPVSQPPSSPRRHFSTIFAQYHIGRQSKLTGAAGALARAAPPERAPHCRCRVVRAVLPTHVAKPVVR